MGTLLFTIEPYVLPIVIGIISVIVATVCVITGIKLIRKQVKLYNSISLVELKSVKAHYWVFMFVIALIMFFIITQMADPEAPEVTLLAEKLNMKRWHTNIMLGSCVGLLVSIEFILLVLARSKCAVVDRGVYTGIKYLDWYHVHDYIIDEDRGLVILTSNKFTFTTIEGTTPPLKVSKNDIPKLKFILNKNKNKFSSFNS